MVRYLRASARRSSGCSRTSLDRDRPQNGVFIDERSDTAFDPRPDPFDIDDQTEYIKALRMDFVLQRRPYTVGLRGYSATRSRLAATTNSMTATRRTSTASTRSSQLGRWFAIDLWAA